MVPPTEHTDDLHSKFEDFEYAPRPQVWDRLEAAAGELGGGVLSEQLGGYTHAPHPRVWNQIESAIHPGKRRKAVLFWWAVAAGIALLLAWTGWQNDWLGQGQSPTQLAAEEQVQPGPQPRPETVPQANGLSDSEDEIPFQEGEALPLTEGQQSRTEASQKPSRLQADSSALPIQDLPMASEFEGGSRFQNGREGWSQDPDMPFRTAERLGDWPKVQLSRVAVIGRPMLLEKFQVDSLPEELSTPDSPDRRVAWIAGIGSNYSPRLTSEALRSYDSGPSYYYNDPGYYQPLAVEQSTSRGYRENFSAPFVLNFNLQRKLGKRWSLVSGLVYTRLRSDRSSFSDEWEFQQQRRRNYLGISLSPRYHFFNRKHYSLYTSIGNQYDFGLGFERQNRDIQNGNEISNVTTNAALGDQMSMLVGLGMDAALTQRLNLNFQLSIVNYFYQSHYNLWTERINWPAASIGLNLEI